jgi:hypothetical protein
MVLAKNVASLRVKVEKCCIVPSAACIRQIVRYASLWPMAAGNQQGEVVAKSVERCG